jgi:hypothetical protein
MTLLFEVSQLAFDRMGSVLIHMCRPLRLIAG